MQWTNDESRYGAVAQLFHWVIVALVVTQFVLARMEHHLPLGAAKIVEMLKPLEPLGERARPTPLLIDMARTGRKFYELDVAKF